MSDLVRETIVVILVIIVICKGSQRNALSPYSKSGNVFTDENTRIAMREDICVNLAFLAYYTRILDKTRKKNLRKLCRKDMIIAGEKQDNGYEMLDYLGEVSYRE